MKHSWFVYGLCGPTVRCGTCGNNACNDESFCDDCDSAYDIQMKCEIFNEDLESPEDYIKRMNGESNV